MSDSSHDGGGESADLPRRRRSDRREQSDHASGEIPIRSPLPPSASAPGGYPDRRTEAWIPPSPGVDPSLGRRRTDAPQPSRPPRSRGRRAITVTMSVLATLAIAALAALSAYLWLTQSAWERQNAELREQAHALGEQLAQSQSAEQARAEELEATAAQLTEAKQRVTELVNDDARAGDSVHVLEDVIDGLIECAEQRQRHIEIVSDPNRVYTAASNAEVEREITRYCTAVIDNWENYQERSRG